MLALASLSRDVARSLREHLRPLVAYHLFLTQLILPGSLDRRRLDALGLRHNRIDEREVELAGRSGYELHAWTTNDRARMSQLIDLGVDAIITDRPALLAELIAERRELGDGALLLIKLHNWLRT